MPTRHFWVETCTPTWHDKARAHPMEIIYGLMGVVFGTMLLLSETALNYFPSPPVANLSYWQGILMGGSLFVGGIFIILAMIGPMSDIELEYLIERTGLGFSFTSWTTYALAVYIWDASYGGALVLGCGMALMGFCRLVVTFIIKKDIDRLLRRWGK